LCVSNSALQRARANRYGEGQISVDEDDGEIDAIAALELLVTVDRDAAEVVSQARRFALEHVQRAGAEATPRALEEHDLDAATRRR
jgi:hypothetical protein